MSELGIKKRHGAYLPHWTRQEGVYSVTFRLFDSIPQEKLDTWKWERKTIVKNAHALKRRLTAEEMTRLNTLHSSKIERYLDDGHGSCWLRRNDIAEIVANALQHFEGDRYRLFTWCVMPNHVHVVLQTVND